MTAGRFDYEEYINAYLPIVSQKYQDLGLATETVGKANRKK
jgi:hypothetical protein